MSTVLGYESIKNAGLPSGIDASYILNRSRREPIAFGEVVQLMASSLAMINQEIVTRWGNFFGVTDEIAIEYPNGGAANRMSKASEYALPDPMRGETRGHMLPLTEYMAAIGGTGHYYRSLTRTKLSADMAQVVNAIRNEFEVNLLTRLFTNTENTVGGSGTDIGFVDGGAGTNVYTPPPYGGKNFTSSHNHYIGFDSASKDFGNVLDDLADTIVEHGHTGELIALCSLNDAPTIRSLPNMIQLVDTAVAFADLGGRTGEPKFYERRAWQLNYVGRYQTGIGAPVAVWSNARVPTGYVAMVSSSGVLSRMNPLLVRYDPVFGGFGAALAFEGQNVANEPLKKAIIEFNFGVGCGDDRTRGAVGLLVSGGSWTNPTIS